MKTREEIKDEYSKEWGWKDYNELYESHKDDPAFMQSCNDEIAERYANEVRTHALQEAAEKAKAYRTHTGEDISHCIDKDSILSLIKEKQH